MCELLVKAVSAHHSDPVKDQRGCYKIGYIVEIRPDGCVYGTSEGLPNFFHIKIPLVPVDHPILQRLMEMQRISDGFEPDGITPKYTTVRRRKCQLIHANIPQAAKDKLASTGELIIKANAAYTGPYDYLWSAVRNYFWNHETNDNSDFTGDLT